VIAPGVLLLLGWASAAASGPGDAPEVRYVVKAVTRSWTPIELKDVEAMIEAKALAELSRSGAMRAAKATYTELKGGDYALQIDGRFIEEAESFSVYLTFGPGTKSDLPSFHVSESGALGGRPRSEMQQRIEQLATAAGKRLATVLSPELESVRLHVERARLEETEIPWSWGPIEVPKVRAPSHAMQTLLDVRNPDHARYQALSEISNQVFDQQAARNAVELCALRDPTPGLRVACVRALGPAARASVPTQRILLRALRNDVDEEVASAILDLAQGFVGLSRKECVESWLEMVASEATPGRIAGRVAELLAKEGDVPNLDLVVARCLHQESLAYGKKQACAESLLPTIPEPRRPAVVHTYLETVEVHSSAAQQVFEPLIGAVFKEGGGGKKSHPAPDPAMFEQLLSIAVRPSADKARHLALYHLRRHPAPTPATMERLVALVPDAELAVDALRAISEIAEHHAELREMTLGALKRLKETVSWFKRPHTQDPAEALDKTIERLGR
jgi:hypothetical protein